MPRLMDDPAVVQRIFDHIDHQSTDVSESSWREPVANYRSASRLAAELAVLRTGPRGFCPSAALPEVGSYVARNAAGTPILAVRGADGRVRAFRNACRHRGAKLADGAGCEKAFVCRYHGWTYGLDGALRHVPHAHGFPGLEQETRGLVPLPTVEQHGVVFVTQEPGRSADDDGLDDLPPLFEPGRRLVQSGTQEIPVNWKVFVESFLEGYHIRPTHRDTFYAVQFDNVNVVEHFGRNSRIVFPYRAVNKLRDVAPAERTADGKLTYVYHLFPNVMVATFPHYVFMVVIEPLTLDQSRTHTYITAAETVPARSEPAPEREGRGTPSAGAALIAAGAAEDYAAACAVQQGLASGANEYLEFGRFEGAIGHFHRNLHAALAERAGAPTA